MGYEYHQRVGIYFPYNGLLGCFRYMEKRDMSDYTVELPKFNMPAICPDCQVPMIHISRYSPLNPLHHYCNVCGTVWQFHNLTCPDCGAICKEHPSDPSSVICCSCKEIYDRPFVEAYTDSFYQYGIVDPMEQEGEIETDITYLIPEYTDDE